MKCKEFFNLYLFCGNSPAGQTHRLIYTLDGSNDADTRKGVPFGGFVDIALHSVDIALHSGVNRPNWHNIESFILSKLLH